MLGILNLNKPQGVTSRDVVNVVQRLIRPVRVGHAGTLDPLATGVLLVCVGKATKLISLLQQQPKVYEAEFVLGQQSDTDDSTGQVEIVDLTGEPPTEDEVREALQAFVGTIEQVPPAFSAVKVNGERAYARARRGEGVRLRAKSVTIHDIELTSFQWPRLSVRIRCGSGTYIRSIARDLGAALGCGGLMSALTRTGIGTFSMDKGIVPDALTADNLPLHLLNPIHVVDGLPRYRCTPTDEAAVAIGRRVSVQAGRWSSRPAAAEDANETIALISDDESRLLALGQPQSGLQQLQPRTVLME